MDQTLCCIHRRPKTNDRPNHPTSKEDIHWINVICEVEKRRQKLSSVQISRAETLVDVSSTSSLKQASTMSQPYYISDEQMEFFEQKGYLIIPDGLSTVEILQLKTWVQEVHDLPRTIDCPYIPYEEVNSYGERILCRTENFANTHKRFGDLLRGAKILSILQQLNGAEMVLFKEKSLSSYFLETAILCLQDTGSQFQVGRLRWFPTPHRPHGLWRFQGTSTPGSSDCSR